MSEPFVTHVAPDLTLVYVDFPVRGREIVTRNEDGSYTALINSRMSADAQRDAIRHALWHIENDDFDKICVQEIEEEAHYHSC